MRNPNTTAKIAGIFLSGCVPVYETIDVTAKPVRLPDVQLGRAKATLVDGFKDPESARFRAIRSYRLSNGDVAICGEVNGRNSYGAYVGYKTFYMRLRPTTSGDEVKSVKSEFLAKGPCDELRMKRYLAIGMQ